MREEPMRQKEPLRDEIEAHGDLLMILIVALMIILSTPSSSPAGGEDGSSREHWTRPVDSGPLTEDIHPERCAVCHMEQYRDWTGAMHSKSAGPGLMAQLAPHAAPEFAVSCYYCHAPLASQSEVIMLPGNNYTSNIMFDKRLQSSGVSCPVCHVREGRIVGTAEN